MLESKWIMKSDLPEVLEIDELNNSWDAWSGDKVINTLQENGTVGKVFLYKGEVVGFAIYIVHKEDGDIELLRFEVHTDCLDTDIPKKILDTILTRAKKKDFKRVRIVVSDDPCFINKHKFWAKMGFSSKVKRNFFSSKRQDGYEFTLNSDKWCLTN